MPFIGKDWRSPGEAWVKTESLGWQRMKIIESQLYPGCHQSHSACSWPPRSQFGQHMANNCCEPDMAEMDGNHLLNRPGVDTNVSVAPSSLLGKGSCSNSSSLNNSPESSRPGSATASPTSSPEKNNGHHLHPITISSPYGRHSCCAHHHIESPCGSPRANSSISFYHHHRQQQQHGDSKDGVNLLTSDNQPKLCCNEDTQTSRQGLSKQQHNSTATLGIGNDPVSPSYVANQNEPLESPEDSQAQSTMEFDSTTIDYNGQLPSTSQRRLASESPVNSRNSGSCPGTPILMRNGRILRGTNDDKIIDHDNNNVRRMEQQIGSPQSDITLARSSSSSSSDCHSNCSVCCCRCSGANNNNLQCLQATHRNQEPQPRAAPHCRISVRTREVAMYNTISEAFYRLDFCNAIHDIRRFNYICKLLHLLITQNLTSLSGCATKVLFTMLEQVAWEVSSNKRNIHVLRNLLDELKLMIQKYYCWGRPIGSSVLWQQHFDTIERISQIVDGIELSPPKVDEDRMTFDKLPIEMVREILLRLNDYRDLVNSAQASPVMRTMIDSQNVWRQLCRYHFNDQQLKLALDSYSFNLAKKSCALRGIKYARTTSADGRISYRNPVTHRQVSPASSSSSSYTSTPTTKSPTTRQQIEQTSSRRNASNRASSSSYVTNAIRMFDSDTARSFESTSSHRSPQQQQQENSDTEVGQQSGPHLSGSSQQIDWERVFHQLRKRFDLREEYADCLLLCRHCRCLFWKSFGHPCMVDDEEVHTSPDKSKQLMEEASHGGSKSPEVTNGDSDTNSMGARGVRRQRADQRPSVASLSRNFDISQVQRPTRPAEPTNLPPTSGPNPNNNYINNDGRPLANRPRQPFDNISALLQDRNNMHNNNRVQQQGINNNRNNGTASNKPNSREELVPKHVTITPQAFLKFFSL